MKIVALTDIHGAYDRATEILQRELPMDVVVLGGDITTNGTPAEAEEAIARWTAIATPLLAVTGNMDPPSIDDLFTRLGISINGRGTMVGKTGFFGVSGSPPTPMQTPNEIAEEEIARRAQAGLDQIRTAQRTIFVPHAPPRRTSVDRLFIGKHVGSTAVRSLIEQHQPDIVICGHIHEARGQDSIGRTQIVNCGSASRGYYATILVDKDITIELKG